MQRYPRFRTCAIRFLHIAQTPGWSVKTKVCSHWPRFREPNNPEESVIALPDPITMLPLRFGSGLTVSVTDKYAWEEFSDGYDQVSKTNKRQESCPSCSLPWRARTQSKACLELASFHPFQLRLQRQFRLQLRLQRQFRVRVRLLLLLRRSSEASVSPRRPKSPPFQSFRYRKCRIPRGRNSEAARPRRSTSAGTKCNSDTRERR